ncbi:MAG: nickel/cobalt efflux transporter RcnA [Pseudomonadales bacterium]|jgi:nickel/cobalt exporter|nr:nickel/cobalt efflux transporter RcnA [Pseudomonadales bacterium]
MDALTNLLQQNAANAWLFAPTAILLGALHGLEPGHSKTMMAAFIIAVRGTVRQAALLGLCATLSHTLVVWVVALAGIWLFADLNAEDTEPYFQFVSGFLIVALALWMLQRTRREQAALAHHHAHEHEYHHHEHHHHEHHEHEHHDDDALNKNEQHELEIMSGDFAGAHEMEHAADIRRRFQSQHVTTAQIVLFGLTGGLVPCPGAITVLLLCLQFERLTLGAALVLCFSIGLALTMVASGVIAALSLKQVAKRWDGFGEIVRKAPYVSSALIMLLGLYLAWHGWSNLPRG